MLVTAFNRFTPYLSFIYYNLVFLKKRLRRFRLLRIDAMAYREEEFENRRSRKRCHVHWDEVGMIFLVVTRSYVQDDDDFEEDPYMRRDLFDQILFEDLSASSLEAEPRDDPILPITLSPEHTATTP